MKRPAAPPAFCLRFLLPEPNKSKHNTDFHEKSDALVIWCCAVFEVIFIILISILQVRVAPPGPVPGPAGLEAAEGADQPGARGALRQVALAHVAAAGNRRANLSELHRFLKHPREVHNTAPMNAKMLT